MKLGVMLRLSADDGTGLARLGEVDVGVGRRQGVVRGADYGTDFCGRHGWFVCMFCRLCLFGYSVLGNGSLSGFRLPSSGLEDMKVKEEKSGRRLGRGDKNCI